MENKAEPGKKDLFSHTTFFSRNMLLNHIIISNLTTDRQKRFRSMIQAWTKYLFLLVDGFPGVRLFGRVALSNGHSSYLYSTLESALPSVMFDKEIVHLLYCNFNCKPLQRVIIHFQGIFHSSYLVLLLNFSTRCPCFLQHDHTFDFFLSTLSVSCCSQKSRYKVRLHSPGLWTLYLKQEAPTLSVYPCGTLRKMLVFSFSFPGPTSIIFTSGTLVYLNQSQNNSPQAEYLCQQMKSSVDWISVLIF